MSVKAVKFGTVVIPAERVQITQKTQEAPPIRQGPGGRSDRVGTRQFKIASLHLGLGRIRGTEVSDDILRQRRNTGVITHLPGGAYLPYVLQTQSTLIAVDVSGWRALNRRLHMLETTLGQSKLRPYFGLGNRLLRTTSDSDHSLASVTSFTDNITAMFEGRFNNTRYATLGFDGTTDDVKGTTDPTGSPPTFSTIFALTAGDRVGGGVFLPTLGANGRNVFYGKISGNNGLHELKTDLALLTAPTRIVDFTSRGVISATNTLISVEKAAGAGANDVTLGADVWTNPSNITASDDASAQNTTPTPDAAGLVALAFGFSIPTGSQIRGITASIEGRHNSGGTLQMGVGLYFDGTLMSGSGKTLNFPTGGDSTQTAGGTGDLWDIPSGISTTVANDPSFGVLIDLGADGNTWNIDQVRMTIHYIPPGTPVSIPSGGYLLGADPNSPDSLYIVAPEFQDEHATINVPKILWRADLAYDSNGDRLAAVLAKPNTGLRHIEAACFGRGGVVVGGDTSSGLGKAIKLVAAGRVIDLGFNSSGQGYTESWGVNNLWCIGSVIIAEIALENATVVQYWVHANDHWQPISERLTVTALPFGYAEDPRPGTELRRRYSLHPNSTTHLAATRQFTPRNLFLDPLRNDTTEVKSDTLVVVETPDLDIAGGEESLKAALTAHCLSREVSATNTIRLRYSMDGGASFTTWTTFTAFMAKATLSTPVKFNTLVIEIGLSHSAGTAGTPSGLPILLEFVSVWSPLRRWEVIINPAGAPFKASFPLRGVDELWDDLAAETVSSPVQTFQAGAAGAAGAGVPAVWTGLISTFEPRDELSKAGSPLPLTHAVVFEEVPQ